MQSLPEFAMPPQAGADAGAGPTPDGTRGGDPEAGQVGAERSCRVCQKLCRAYRAPRRTAGAVVPRLSQHGRGCGRVTTGRTSWGEVAHATAGWDPATACGQ